jgi:hypothetical protein
MKLFGTMFAKRLAIAMKRGQDGDATVNRSSIPQCNAICQRQFRQV